MIAGLVAPFVSGADPDTLGEGSLDPLGLFGIADRLADQLAPEVTARMSRPRLLTTIAIGSNVLVEPEAWTDEVGTPAYLAFEWLVVEAFARRPPPSGTVGIPGIGKAGARVSDPRRHLSRDSYLQVPKVFGFHGVYKRLARDLALVDGRFELLERGEQLVSAWERDQRLEGFAAKASSSPGAKLARRLREETRNALESGEVRLGPSSQYWQIISRSLAPGAPGRRERKALWAWLTETVYPVRHEVAEWVAAMPNERLTERKIVELMLLDAGLSSELRRILRAISAYENVVRLLDDGFSILRAISTNRGARAVPVAELAKHGPMTSVANDLPGAMTAALARLEEVSLAVDLSTALEQFLEPMGPTALAEALLLRHEEVQGRKDKRPWFERDERGFVVRGVQSLDGWEPRVGYLHPYRLLALQSFARDVAPS